MPYSEDEIVKSQHPHLRQLFPESTCSNAGRTSVAKLLETGTWSLSVTTCGQVVKAKTSSRSWVFPESGACLLDKASSYFFSSLSTASSIWWLRFGLSKTVLAACLKRISRVERGGSKITSITKGGGEASKGKRQTPSAVKEQMWKVLVYLWGSGQMSSKQQSTQLDQCVTSGQVECSTPFHLHTLTILSDLEPTWGPLSLRVFTLTHDCQAKGWWALD